MSLQIDLGSSTRYIISTSGRPSSLNRYNKFLQKLLGLDVAYIPISSGLEDPKISPERFAWALRGLPCLGGAISRDIKGLIVPYLDEIEPLAAEVKSVNTVVVRNGKLCGYNTDIIGFRQAIETGIAKSGLSIKTAVCYGYGGVTSVVVAVLKSLGIRVFITGRRLDEAERRAAEMGAEALYPTHLNPSSSISPPVSDPSTPPMDLFVNAAPVTDQPLSGAPNLLPALSSCSLVFDHEMPGVYLLAYCQEKIQTGSTVVHIAGREMYYPTMTAQWSFFLEREIESRPELKEEGKLEALLREAETL